MMTYVRDVYDFLNQIAPFAMQMDFDNSGLQTGSFLMPVTHAMVSLDASPGVIEQAAAAGCELIVAHHPVLFRARKQLLDHDPAWLLAKHGLACIAAHTPYDMCAGGVNDVLAQHLALGETTQIGALLRVCTLPQPMTAAELSGIVKQRLGAPVRYCDAGKPIQTVALCGGLGGTFLLEVCGHADAYLTGDADHHNFLDALQHGISLFAAGHYETEIIAVSALAQRLQAAFPAVEWHTAEETSVVTYA